MGEVFREMMRGLALLVLAIGIPLFALSPPDWLVSWLHRRTAPSTAATPAGSGVFTYSPDVYSHTTEKPIGGPPLDDGAAAVPIAHLTEVIRFDRSPQWVEQRWPKVVTRLNEGSYYGYRVPLSTGTNPADLVGVLTYYYDVNGQTQCITFQGATDDYTSLTTLLQRYYGFVRRPMNSPTTVVYERPTTAREVPSRVWIEPSVGVIQMKRRHRYDVTMVVQRPGAMSR